MIEFTSGEKLLVDGNPCVFDSVVSTASGIRFYVVKTVGKFFKKKIRVFYYGKTIAQVDGVITLRRWEFPGEWRVTVIEKIT